MLYLPRKYKTKKNIENQHFWQKNFHQNFNFVCIRGVFNPAKKIIARIKPGGNDGIDDDKVAFGEQKSEIPDEDEKLMQSSEDDLAQDEEPKEKIKHRAFKTHGGDRNDDTEVAIVNELEVEKNVVKRDLRGGKRLVTKAVELEVHGEKKIVEMEHEVDKEEYEEIQRQKQELKELEEKEVEQYARRVRKIEIFNEFEA